MKFLYSIACVTSEADIGIPDSQNSPQLGFQMHIFKKFISFLILKSSLYEGPILGEKYYTFYKIYSKGICRKPGSLSSEGRSGRRYSLSI